MGAENPYIAGRDRRIGWFNQLENEDQLPRISREVGKKDKLEIHTFNIPALIQIMDWAYGLKDWQSRSEKYWKDQTWEYQSPDQKLKRNWSKETKKTYKYLKQILEWTRDPETRGHLDPAPGIPVYNDAGEIINHELPDLQDQTGTDLAIANLASYYFNKGEPRKIQPFLATSNSDANDNGQLLGVLTLRWKGDAYVPMGHNIASIERLVVNPKKRGRGVGSKLTSTAIEFAFDIYKGYGKDIGGKGAEEIRVWVMADREAGDYSVNLNFFRNLGFRVLASPYRHWSDYAKLINEKTDREALWLSLKKDDWIKAKEKSLKVGPYDIIGLNK